MKPIKYAIRSKLNGKYLSNLFEDTHAKTFQASEPKSGAAYFWNIKQIAESIAQNENGEVIEVTN
jgi:hypothetical protein